MSAGREPTIEERCAHALRSANLSLDVIDLRNGPYCNDLWGLLRKHQRDRIRQLVIAGALIAAEIDRMQRLYDSAKRPYSQYVTTDGTVWDIRRNEVQSEGCPANWSAWHEDADGAPDGFNGHVSGATLTACIEAIEEWSDTDA